MRGLHTALSSETNGEREYKILKFWAYYGTAMYKEWVKVKHNYFIIIIIM